MAKVELTKAIVERWKREGAQGVSMRKYIFANEWETLCDLALKGLETAPTEALRIPEGWKLVPITPTGEMVDAGAETPGMKVIDGIVSTYQLRNGLRTIPELECDSSATSAIGKAYTAMVEAVRSPRGTK